MASVEVVVDDPSFLVGKPETGLCVLGIPGFEYGDEDAMEQIEAFEAI